MSTNGDAAPRDPRHTAFVTVTIAFLVFLYLFSPFTQVVLGWFVEFEDNISHHVHEVTFGALFSIIFVGVLAQLRVSTRSYAGLVQAAVAALSLSAIIALTTGWEWPELMYIVPLSVLLWLHPGRSEFFSYRLRPHRASVVMMLLISGPLIQAVFKEYSKAANEVRQHQSHWSGMAAFALTLLVVGFLAALRVHGWPLLTWTTAGALFVYATVSFLYRFDASARPEATAVLAMMWSVVYVVVARRAAPVPAEARAGAAAPQPTPSGESEARKIDRRLARGGGLVAIAAAVALALTGNGVSVPLAIFGISLVFDLRLLARLRRRGRGISLRRRRDAEPAAESSRFQIAAGVVGRIAAGGVIVMFGLGVSLLARATPPVPHTIESMSPPTCLRCHATGDQFAPVIEWRTHNLFDEPPRTTPPWCAGCHALPPVTPSAAGLSPAAILAHHAGIEPFERPSRLGADATAAVIAFLDTAGHHRGDR